MQENFRFQSGSSIEIGLPLIHKILLCAAILLYIGLCIGHARTQRPWSDEGWFASASHNLATTGSMGTPVLEAIREFQGVDRHTYWVMPLHLAIQGVWFKVFGSSILSMRMLSVVFGMILICAVYEIIRRLSNDRKIGVLAASLLSLDYYQISGATFGRMDMMAAGLGFAGLAVYLHFRERSFYLAILLSHVLVGASLLTHPLAFMYFASLLFLQYFFDRQRLGPIPFGLAVFPYLVGILGWLIYILPNWHDFAVQFSGTTQGDLLALLKRLPSPWQAITREINDRYLVAYGLAGHHPGHSSNRLIILKSLALGAIILGLIGVLSNSKLRNQPGVRALLFISAIFFTILTFLEKQKYPTFLIHIVPLYLGILAIWIHSLGIQRRIPKWMITISVAGLLMLNIVGILWKIKLNEYQRRYLPTVQVLKQHMKPNSLVMGSADLAFDLGFTRNHIDDSYLGYFTGKRPDLVFVDEIYEEAFDGARRQNPEIYRHIQEVLKSYQVVYNESLYKIYISGPLVEKK
jgi:4-amino-4-deoxy-L-arabinose transferase-like glycosyltransferase